MTSLTVWFFLLSGGLLRCFALGIGDNGLMRIWEHGGFQIRWDAFRCEHARITSQITEIGAVDPKTAGKSRHLCLPAQQRASWRHLPHTSPGLANQLSCRMGSTHPLLSTFFFFYFLHLHISQRTGQHASNTSKAKAKANFNRGRWKRRRRLLSASRLCPLGIASLLPGLGNLGHDPDRTRTRAGQLKRGKRGLLRPS